MAWSVSAIFQQAMLNPITASAWSTTEPTTYGANGLSADTIDVALFGAVTPDKAAVVGSTGYNTGTWTTGSEVVDATNWVAGGRALANKTFTIDSGSSSICFHADNLAGAGVVTLTAFFGCFVYDFTITAGTVAKQGLCFNYFGGTNTITAGTFTILWATPGGGGVTAVFNIAV